MQTVSQAYRISRTITQTRRSRFHYESATKVQQGLGAWAKKLVAFCDKLYGTRMLENQ